MKKLYTAIMILAGLAFVNATYLTYKALGLGGTQGFCDVNAQFSCSNVLAAPEAFIFSVIPFPAVAMIVYPVIFILALLGYKQKKTKYFNALAIISAAGILFNGYFIYMEATVIKSYCILCLICSAIIVTILILSLIGRKR